MSITGRARGEYAKTAARREEILRASLEVFSASGYRSGSIREVADLVGMSQAGLLHHFSSKSELLQAVLTQRDAEALERLGIGPELPRGLDLLRAMVDNVDSNAGTPGLVALFAVLSGEATNPEHPAHGYFAERYAYVVGMLRVAFEQVEADGLLRSGTEPASAARAFVAVMDGLQLQWLHDPDGVDMAAEARRFLQALVDAPV